MYIPKRNGLMDKLVQKLYIADSKGYWFRNIDTFDKICKSTVFRDDIVEAFNEEKEHLLEYLSNRTIERSRSFKTSTTLQLGGWFRAILNNQKTVFTEVSELTVEAHPFSSGRSVDYKNGGDYETDDCLVRIL